MVHGQIGASTISKKMYGFWMLFLLENMLEGRTDMNDCLQDKVR